MLLFFLMDLNLKAVSFKKAALKKYNWFSDINSYSSSGWYKLCSYFE